MTGRDDRPGDADGLRLRAEELARGKAALSPENIEALSPEQVRRTLHDLRVHQIELEMQNEELRQAQVELEAARARYFDRCDLAPVGYCTVSEQGLILEANLTAAGLLGLTRGALVQQRLTSFILPEDQDIYYQLRKMLFATGEPQACELRMVKKDAAPFWAHLAATAAEDAGGALECRVVMSDITERKRAEEEIRAGKEEFDRFFALVPDLAVVASSDGFFKKLNPAWEKTLGFSIAELLSQPLESFIHPDDVAASRRAVLSRIDGSSSVGFVNRYRTKSGGYRWLEWMATPAAGNSSLYATARDITERKRAEEERERLRAQLAQAQKMETIGRLAGGVAHDFNNLLTVINGYSILALRRVQPGDPLLHGLTEILRAGERAAALVRQLLAFSRKQVLQPEVLDLNVTVGDMEKLLRRLVGEDIEIVVRLDPGVAPVLADRHQLEQVIMNLAVNARDAMPDGGTLTLETGERRLEGVCRSCHDQIRPGVYVELTVRDTGTGMDGHTLEHLFEPFFTTKGVGTGTGLGLSTVQGIVVQSGGHVRVESEVGRGSAFHICLPVAERLTAEPGPLPPADVEGGTETILLVEDHQEVRRFIAAILGDYGYRVLETGDAEQALRVCAAQPVDLLVTDVVMPKMRGVELARRAQLALPGLRTLFISGYSEDTHERKWASVAGANFLQKPFAPKALAAKVREVLEVG